MYACVCVCHGEGLFCEFALKISYTDSAIIHVAAANTEDLRAEKSAERAADTTARQLVGWFKWTKDGRERSR